MTFRSRLFRLALGVAVLSLGTVLTAVDSHAQATDDLALTPVIGVNPQSLDFGRVCLGACQDLTIEVFNGVTDPESHLVITNLQVSPGPAFELINPPTLPDSVAGGAPGIMLTVRFCPQQAGAASGDLTITAREVAPGSPNPLVVPLSGSGNNAPVCDVGGPYSGNQNQSISFDGSASTDPDGTPLTYAWDFGDGNTGSGPTPSHTYTDCGPFTVTLVVTDDCTDTTCETGVDVNCTPICDAGGPYGGVAGQPVQFDGTASTDPDGTIVSYQWDFGDGNTGTGPTPTHTYGSGGVFTVTLCVTDDLQLEACCETTANIGGAPNEPPVCDAGGLYTGTEGQPVQFDGTASTDPDGTIVLYEWDFGDGATGTGPTPTHTYATGGLFIVTLCVTDDLQARVCCQTEAEINALPICDAGGPYAGPPNAPIQFDGTGSTDPDGMIVLYEWDFGDGAMGTGPTPTHSYAQMGVYTVTLCVTDDDQAQTCCETFADIGATPVELSSFTASSEDGAVILNWSTSVEESNLGFHVERAEAGDITFARINQEMIEGNGDSPGDYSYRDNTAALGGIYDYRLVALDRQGGEQRFGPIQVSVARSVPARISLSQNQPNPFNPSTTITYALPERTQVTLRIYDAQGHLIRTLVNGEQRSAAEHSVEWNGRDDRGRSVSTGVYLYRLEAGSKVLQNKMILAK
jgi:PKD repeat protein